MERYTIEDIEFIRRKSGISYQEAVALLDYHNGNVARALVDLERNGRIKPESAQAKPETQHKGNGWFSKTVSRLFQCRIKVKRKETLIMNATLLFSIVTLLISPHLALLALILCLILGYHISLEKRDPEFASDDLESVVRNAAQNVRSSVGDFTRSFTESMNSEDKNKPTSESKDEPAQEKRSFYQSNPAATTAPVDYTGRAPVLQVPVQVESQDGSVAYSEDKDGYGNATIE